MTNLILRLTLFFVSTVLGASLWAVPRNPPPVFDTDYQLPTTHAPMPEASLHVTNGLATAFYVVLLVLTLLAVYRFRSRKIIFGLTIISTVILGFVFHGCPCPVGMVQNILDGLLNPNAYVPLTVMILFALPLVTALFFGRVFCASVCPIGAVQEILAFKPVKIPNVVDDVLGLFRYFWLGLGLFFVATGLGYMICQFDPIVPVFRHLSGLPGPLTFTVMILGIGLIVGRPYCRFLCPYSVLLGLCASVTAKKVTVTPGRCSQCRLCEAVCPYNAILTPTTPPNAEERRRGPMRLLITIAVFPLLLAFFGYLGYKTAPLLSYRHHAVRTAQLLYAEEMKYVQHFGTFPETKTLILSGIDGDTVYLTAEKVMNRFRVAGLYLGLWFGVVIATKLISIQLRRRRTDYEVDPSRCLACGRCFWYCPNQQSERHLLTEPEPQS